MSNRLQHLEGASTTKLRILQSDGKKFAIKLENIFWSQLSEFAKEDRTKLSTLVVSIVSQSPAISNKTSLLRCYCADRARKKQAQTPLAGHSFDLFALAAACPSPIAIITRERKLTAFNPAFSVLATALRESSRFHDREIQLSFSQPLINIQTQLLAHPNDIRIVHLGVKIGDSTPRYFNARFAIADRSKGMDSLIVIFLEGAANTEIATTT